MKVKTVEELVKQVLEEKPQFAENDFRLYGAVLKKIGVNLDMPLKEFLWYAQERDYPSLEGVPRTRRKLFAIYPEFKNLKTQLAREKKEREYISYSRGEN